MTVRVTHTTTSDAPDSGDGKLSSNAWNEDHTIEGLQEALDAKQTRRVLTAHTTFHVDTHGDDGGDGSADDPWATTQHAFDVLAGTDLYGYDATIQLSDDAHLGGAISGLHSSRAGVADGFSPTIWNYTPTVWIQGNAADASAASLLPTNEALPFVLSAAGTQEVNLGIRNFTIDYTNPPADAAIVYTWRITLFVGDYSGASEMRAQSVTGDLFSLNGGAIGIIMDKLRLSGTFDYAFYLGQSNLFVWSEIAAAANTNFGGPFMLVGPKSLAQFDGATFTNEDAAHKATGQRFRVEAGGVVDLSLIAGSDETAFLGSTAGVVHPGGQYISANRSLINYANLPTADPHVIGMMWNSAGTPKISAG